MTDEDGVSVSEVILSKHRVAEFYDLDDELALYKLEDLTGLNLITARWNDGYFATGREVAEKIRRLCGPHWRTILKAHEVNNG